MAKIKKKGVLGAAQTYMTRTRAIKKLQLSLADFRRLCILKGVYPREPSNKKKASGNNNANNTFYFAKDIRFLLHEPIVQKIRDRKAFLRKLRKAIGKHQKSVVESLEKCEPKYTLDHVVKERYPSFVDAVRDLDDCLCHIFLFATLPITKCVGKNHVEESRRLAAEFQNYVVASRSLKKTFLSIKGIYYQAEIRGQLVTWLVPYQFSQEIPHDVDFRVMLTFLEFHQSLLGFVNYKLYADINMMYPPQLDAGLEESGAGLLSSYVMRPVEELALVGAADEAMVAAVDTADKKRQKVLRKEAIQKLKTLNEKLADLDSEEASAIDADMDGVDADINNDADSCARASTSLFSNVVVFLSREVPRYSLEFVLRAFGATVCYPETSGLGSPYDESAPEITHQIVDRPEVNVVPGRVYVQPQWVYDSINRGELVKETDYGVGKLLPPHLSPFVTYREGDYVPEQDQHEDAVNGEMDDVMEESVDVASATASKTTTTDSVIIAKAKQMLGSGEATEAHVEQLELEAEAAGIPYSEFAATTTTKTTMTTRSITASTGTAIEPAQLVKQRQQQKQEQQRKREEQERRELAKMVMSNKQRKLLDCIDKGKAKRLAEADTLRAKKQAATKSKAVARK